MALRLREDSGVAGTRWPEGVPRALGIREIELVGATRPLVPELATAIAEDVQRMPHPLPQISIVTREHGKRRAQLHDQLVGRVGSDRSLEAVPWCTFGRCRRRPRRRGLEVQAERLDDPLKRV